MAGILSGMEKYFPYIMGIILSPEDLLHHGAILVLKITPTLLNNSASSIPFADPETVDMIQWKPPLSDNYCNSFIAVFSKINQIEPNFLSSNPETIFVRQTRYS